MFHIDFGFIFGQDPKPMPPPFRFIRAMADAMGGEEGEGYGRFKSYCCQVGVVKRSDITCFSGPYPSRVICCAVSGTDVSRTPSCLT
jgi:hypothetical protein